MIGTRTLLARGATPRVSRIAFLTLFVLCAILSLFALNEPILVIANGVLLAFFYIRRPSFLSGFYVGYVSLTFLVPTVMRWAFGDISTEFDRRDYSEALTLLLRYDLAFIAVISFMTPQRPVTGLSAKLSDLPIQPILICYAMSLLAMGYLSTIGQFRVMERGQSSPILGILTALAQLGVVPLLLLGARSLLQIRADVILYVAAAAISLSLGFLTGSRWSFLQIVLVIGFVEANRNRAAIPMFFIAGVPLLLIVFPFMMIFRNSGHSVSAAVSQWSLIGTRWFEVFDSIFADRFNYVQVVQRVIDRTRIMAPDVTPYADNIIGLIPRVFWPSKPVIGMNLNHVAHMLGLVDVTNVNTAIGLSVVGEGFYLLKGWGPIVGAFQALMFAGIERIGRIRNQFWRASYVMMALVFVVKDSYANIIPLLATYIVALGLFYLVFEGLRMAVGSSSRRYRRARNPSGRA